MKLNKEVILYLLFGGLTTLVNIVTYAILAKWAGMDYKVATTIAWIAAVLFAYITNKIYVFQSKDMNRKNVIREFTSFIFFRGMSYLLDIGTMILLVEIASQDDLLSKIIANIFVVIFNYVASKYFIFIDRQKK